MRIVTRNLENYMVKCCRNPEFSANRNYSFIEIKTENQEIRICFENKIEIQKLIDWLNFLLSIFS